MESENKTGRYFIALALMMLILGVLFGVHAATNYIHPGYSKSWLGFVQLRPLHVSSVVFFILIGASGCVYTGLNFIEPNKISKTIAYSQLGLWLIAILFILFSYSNSQFGGREYWEFPPKYAIIIVFAWLLFLINFLRVVVKIKKWPVYIWMWMTGIFFFLLTFSENYLWVFPFFRDHFVKDMTIQWKANGSLVGSWNQLIYGTAFFLIERISNDKSYAKSNLAFVMYFLGLFNLMFNWGHHIYTLPTESYIRYVSYIVSMTEWIFLARIIYMFRNSITEAQKLFHHFPYWFLFASEIWVFLNLMLAIIMSVPTFNLYTHGTHITVAHAMGTTIGINTMILLGACFEILKQKNNFRLAGLRLLNFCFWTIQISLFVFWVTLIIIGMKKGIWQMGNHTDTFNMMMSNLYGEFQLFVISGSVLMIAITVVAITLLVSFFKDNFTKNKIVV